MGAMQAGAGAGRDGSIQPDKKEKGKEEEKEEVKEEVKEDEQEEEDQERGEIRESPQFREDHEENDLLVNQNREEGNQAIEIEKENLDMSGKLNENTI